MPKRQSPTSFEYRGFTFKLRARIGDIALYEKEGPTYHAGWEVVIIKPPGKAFKCDGRVITPQHETVPASGEWGRLGWSFRDHADALAKFESLCKRRSKAKQKSE